MPKYAKTLQEKLKKNNRQMAKALQIYDSRAYITYKSAKGGSVTNFLRLYLISEMSAEDYLTMALNEHLPDGLDTEPND